MYSLYVSIRVFKPSTLNYESSCHWWSSSTVWSCDLRYSSVRWTQRCWVLNPGLFASEQQSCWVCASMKTVPVRTLFETAIKTKKMKKKEPSTDEENIFFPSISITITNQRKANTAAQLHTGRRVLHIFTFLPKCFVLYKPWQELFEFFFLSKEKVFSYIKTHSLSNSYERYKIQRVCSERQQKLPLCVWRRFCTTAGEVQQLQRERANSELSKETKCWTPRLISLHVDKT